MSAAAEIVECHGPSAEIIRLDRDIFTDHAWGESKIASHFTAGGRGFLARAANASAIGFSLWRAYADEAELLQIGVAPAARRRGFAAAMIIQMLGDARKMSVKHMFLEVDANNADAISCYESVGFAPIGRRKKYYSNGADAIVMAVRWE